MGTKSDLVRHLRETYQQAYSDLEAIAHDYWMDLEWRDNAVRRAMKKGEIVLTAADKAAGINTVEDWYKAWRKAQIGRGQRWDDLKEQMAMRLVRADEIAAVYMNEAQPELFMNAYNKAATKLERECSSMGMKVRFNQVDESTAKWLATAQRDLLPESRVNIPKDLRWNMRLIQSQIEQAVLQGDDVNRLTERIKNVTNAGEHAARRMANTIANRCGNAGRLQNSHDAEEAGIIMGKWWMSMDDPPRARETHMEAGRIYNESNPIPIDEPFIVDGEAMDCPCDPTASPQNVYNCRCQMMQKVMGFKRKLTDIQRERGQIVISVGGVVQ